eukprot:2527543-Pyramimonas_sp.AAC.3
MREYILCASPPRRCRSHAVISVVYVTTSGPAPATCSTDGTGNGADVTGNGADVTGNGVDVMGCGCGWDKTHW